MRTWTLERLVWWTGIPPETSGCILRTEAILAPDESKTMSLIEINERIRTGGFLSHRYGTLTPQETNAANYKRMHHPRL